jgi:DNA phosphorothioation-dependent restriction protein DptG
MMEDKASDERNWWLWQMYRQVASLINNPCEITEAKLRVLISEYRNMHERKCDNSDPHERLMDYR